MCVSIIKGNSFNVHFKPGFHMIAGIAGDARIAQFVTSDRCVEMETVLFSLPAIVALPAILAFQIENFLSLRSQRSLRQREVDRA